MTVDDGHAIIGVNDGLSANEDRLTEMGNASQVLTRVELDLAYCSEKTINLDTLLIHVESRLGDYEDFSLENGSSSQGTIQKAFEFDILSGILYTELKELDSFMESVRAEVVDTLCKVKPGEHLEVEEKLHDAGESLRQLQEQVAEIKIQATKFESTLALGRKEAWHGEGKDFPENGHIPLTKDKWKMNTAEKQRDVLQMLEKSLARELDLEKGLTDSMHNEKELRSKLQLAERETYCLEERMESIQERLFEAENASEVLMGISNALMSKLQIAQFIMKNSLQRENEMRHKLQESLLKLSAQESAVEELKTSASHGDSLMLQVNSLNNHLKEAEEKYVLANLEVLNLTEKVNSLEKLKESNEELQQAKISVEESRQQQSLLSSELVEKKHFIEHLHGTLATAEQRADDAEAKCILLSGINSELRQELALIKNSSSEKENLLDDKLKESEAQLEHANVSIEALEEQQSLLYSALGDMENLMEDLKMKFSKAESRAESAESKCILLTETNLELNEELVLLRGRLEVLEKMICQADEAKRTTAKDIGIKAKVITDLVMKLASERERLQSQISRLAKENQTLGQEWWKRKGSVCASCHEMHANEKVLVESFEESVTESSATNFQAGNHAGAVCGASVEEDATAAASNARTVTRSIDAGQPNSKLLLLALLVLVISICGGTYVFQLERPV